MQSSSPSYEKRFTELIASEDFPKLSFKKKVEVKDGSLTVMIYKDIKSRPETRELLLWHKSPNIPRDREALFSAAYDNLRSALVHRLYGCDHTAELRHIARKQGYDMHWIFINDKRANKHKFILEPVDKKSNKKTIIAEGEYALDCFFNAKDKLIEAEGGKDLGFLFDNLPPLPPDMKLDVSEQQRMPDPD